MTRRQLLSPQRQLAAAVACIAAALTLSSCATFENADVVARSGGEELTETELRGMLESPLAEHPALLGAAPIDGFASGEGVRRVVNFWIGLTAISSAGLLDQAAMDGIREELATQLGAQWTETSPELQDLAVELNTVTIAQQDGSIQPGTVDAAVRAAEIYISPRYGRWDADMLRVEANS